MPRTWVGWLNFLILQWFGVRLARVLERRVIPHDVLGASLEAMGTITREKRLRIGGYWATVGYTWIRWVWPLTGWWSDYRWIRRAKHGPR